MIERVLTVRQPWADLSIHGAAWEGGKHVENRTWPVPSTLPQWYRCECGRRERGAEDVRLVRHYHPAPARMEWKDMAPDGPFPFRLWIHASLRPEPASHPAWTSWALLAGDDERGAIIGARTVVGCHHADTCREHRGQFDQVMPEVVERIDYCSQWSDPDAWHWVYDRDPASIITLDEPVPARGRLGLWPLPDDVADQLARQEVA